MALDRRLHMTVIIAKILLLKRLCSRNLKSLESVVCKYHNNHSCCVFNTDGVLLCIVQVKLTRQILFSFNYY